MNLTPVWSKSLLFTFVIGAPSPLANAANTPALHWERNAFALSQGIWSVEAIDANADGRLDLIAMGETKVFALLAPDWKPTVLADVRDGKMLYCVRLDADGDRDQDLALGRYQVPWIDYRQGLTEGKAGEKPVGPDFSVAWIENIGRTGEPWPWHVIDAEINGIHGLCVGDVNRDGVKDLIADSINGPHFANSLAWFKTPARGGTLFKREVITKNGADGRPHYLDFADLKRNGRGGVLLGDSQGGTFTFWQQSATNEPWKKELIAREPGATNIKAADLNQDGILDVVGSCGHGKGVFWFEGPLWKKHDIDPALATPHALACGDFDRDGDMDIATASFSAWIVRWYENDGRGSFIPHDLDVAHQQQAYDLKVVDLDADGRLDLILAGRESRNAVWYRNQK